MCVVLKRSNTTAQINSRTVGGKMLTTPKWNTECGDIIGGGDHPGLLRPNNGVVDFPSLALEKMH